MFLGRGPTTDAPGQVEFIFEAGDTVVRVNTAGAGAPEVEAVVREERPEPVVNPFAELVAALFAGVAALWRSLTGPPTERIAPAPQSAAHPTGEPQL